MLIGTTFAWFTDSVTSAGNRIQSGSLKVDLLMDKAKTGNVDDYKSIANGEGDIFSEATGNGILWEPGKTEIVYLAVENKGNLALKYNIVLDITDMGLAGALEYAVIDDAKATDLAAASKWADVEAYTGAQIGDMPTGKQVAAPNGKLNAKDIDYFALAVHMKEEAGNEYQEKSIEIDLQVQATQATEESDSFNNKYDDGAFYYGKKVASAAELEAAIAAGEKIIAIDGMLTLTRSLGASGVTMKGIGTDSGIDFGAYGISGPNNTFENLALDNDRDGWYKGMQYSDGEDTTYINCTIVNGVTTYGNSTFKNCKFNELPAGNYALFIYDGKTITVDGCEFQYGNRAIKIYNEGGSMDIAVSISNTKFTASETTVANKAMIEIDDRFMDSIKVTVEDIKVDAAIAAQGVYRINDGALDTSTDKSKVSVNGVVTTAVATNATELNEAIAAGDEVAVELAAGNYSLPGITNKELTISGTKDTVITINKPAYSGSDLTLEGVTVKGSGYSTGVQHVKTVTYKDVTIVGEMCLYGDEVSFTNCTFELAKGQYIWTYDAKKVTFEGCVFNTAGKAILVYHEGATTVCDITVKNCVFNATASDKAGTITNQACAAIEIGSNLATSGHYTVTTSGNTVDSDFSGEWRIKASAGKNATVNGVAYEAVTLDGVAYTLSGTTVTKK